MAFEFTNESKVLLVSTALVVLLIYGNCNRQARLETFSAYGEELGESNQLLQKSNGTFDAHAMNALHLIERKKLEDRTLTDHLNAAKIRHLYRDQGFVDVNTHSYDAMPHYIQALVKARTSTYLPASEILSATESAQSYLAKIKSIEQHRIKRIDAPNVRLDQRITAQQAELQHQIKKTQDTIQQQTLGSARSVSNNKADTIQRYLEKSKGWNVDQQNVHDSSVMVSLKDTVRKLGRSDEGIMAPPDEQDVWSAVKNYIECNAQRFSEAKRQDALFALNVIRGSHGIHSGMEYPENKIFEMTWRRAYHPINQSDDRASSIKDMIVENLADSTVELGNNQKGTVCTSGRIGRTLSSLTMTDADSALGGDGAMTVDAIRNETFEYAQKEIKRQLNLYKESEIPEQMALVLTYEKPSSSTSATPAVEQQFKSEVMKQVNDHIEQQYSGKLTPGSKQALLDHVQAGI